MLEYKEEMIDVEPICEKFNRYIEVDNRCILSAKFGDGKSYFLSQFIKKYSNKYLFITIYPVNYQVMDNKEIFELIKRDILLRLLSEKAISNKKINYKKSFQSAYYLRENCDQILENLIAIIPQFNFSGFDINIGNIYKGIKKIRSNYQQWIKEINETEEERANKFINEFNYKKGSINEFDVVSQFIYNIISDYKRCSKKKVVLIIEDLDRIDPGHIFRILNVFSAHFDNQSYGENNKYNFDKIITVCDYNNIKNIYHHVYGDNTDFIGYITKFSNREPFYYSLYELIRDYIRNNLLHKNLLQYKGICNALCDNIMSFLNGQNDNYNLRIVKERLDKVEKSIYNINIPLDNFLKGYYINSFNTFAYLLAILKGFSIDENKVLNNNYIDEIIYLIGINWLILSRSSDGDFLKPILQQTGTVVKIYLKRDTGLYHYENDEAGEFEILSGEENLITGAKLLIYISEERQLKNFLFNRKNEIIEYYKDNIIL